VLTQLKRVRKSFHEQCHPMEEGSEDLVGVGCRVRHIWGTARRPEWLQQRACENGGSRGWRKAGSKSPKMLCGGENWLSPQRSGRAMGELGASCSLRNVLREG
jgi:hypothetical protein